MGSIRSWAATVPEIATKTDTARANLTKFIRAFAKPKSSTFTVPSEVTLMLAGFSDLQGNITIQTAVMSAVHLTHPACANCREGFVRAQKLTDLNSHGLPLIWNRQSITLSQLRQPFKFNGGVGRGACGSERGVRTVIRPFRS
jgi:hypothetical protein